MEKCCKRCKYYEFGKCVRENFDIVDETELEVITDRVTVEVKEPDKFYCSNWE